MYRYYENCVCGASATLEAPTNSSYEWKGYVQDWRENHKHEIRPVSGYLAGLANPIGYTQANVDVNEETLDDN